MRIAANASSLLFIFLEVEEFSREQVATVDVFTAVRTTPLACTTIFPIRGRTVWMRHVKVVPLAAFDERHEQVLQPRRVGCCFVAKDVLEFLQQVHRLRLRTAQHLHVVYHQSVKRFFVMPEGLARHILARVRLADVRIEERRHVSLCMFLEYHVVHVWVIIFQRFIESSLSFHNEVELWVPRDVSEPVRVWVPTVTELEAEPVVEKAFLRSAARYAS